MLKFYQVLLIGLDISQTHRIDHGWQLEYKMYLHQNRDIIITHIESNAKPNIFLLSNSTELEAYTCTVIPVQLVSHSSRLEEKLYKLHHNTLSDDSNPNLKITGTYHYQEMPSKMAPLSFIKLMNNPLCQSAKSIVECLSPIASDYLVDAESLQINIFDANTEVGPPDYSPSIPSNSCTFPFHADVQKHVNCI